MIRHSQLFSGFNPALPALALFITLLACSDRPRSNPLDPQNTDSNNANAGFNALAGNEQVLLHWDQLTFEDLRGIRVQRAVEGSGDTLTLTDSSLSAKSTFFLDNSAENGTTYSYNLQFMLNGSSERPKSKPDLATPGEVFGWLELVDYGEVVLMTPDFRDEITSLNVSFPGIIDIQVGPAVWVLDGSSGQINRYSLNGEALDEGAILNSVRAFRFNQQDFTAWVAVDGDNGIVYHFSSSGELLSSFNTNLPVTWLALEYLRGQIWVGSSSQAVARFDPIVGNIVQFTDPEFVSPQVVVVGQNSTLAYILDSGARKVFQVDNSGVAWKLGGFSNPSDIAVDINGDFCWVTDPDADKLFEIDRHGKITAQVTGLGKPHRLIYDDRNSTLYVTGTTGEITNLSPGGVINWQVKNPYQPGRIALQFAH